MATTGITVTKETLLNSGVPFVDTGRGVRIQIEGNDYQIKKDKKDFIITDAMYEMIGFKENKSISSEDYELMLQKQRELENTITILQEQKMALTKQIEDIKVKTNEDVLTGLKNNKAFNEELVAANRENTILALISLSDLNEINIERGKEK